MVATPPPSPGPSTGRAPKATPVAAPPLFARAPYRVEPPAPFLPTTRAEMDALGWDACDVLLVTGDAYVDHPSFGMALVGRLLEAQGFRVAILAQPEWSSAEAFKALGRPRLYVGVTGGNMDSMVNRYTSDRRLRSDDAYTPGGVAGKRPDRAVLVYAQRCREALPGVPIVIGGIESSLRRIAHYDYWSEKVRRSVLFDAKADLLLYGNAERALVELTWRLADGEAIGAIRDLRGTAFALKAPLEGFHIVDSTSIDTPGPVEAPPDPYMESPAASDASCASSEPAPASASAPAPGATPPPPALILPKRVRERSAIRLPSYEAVAADPILYAHASRVLHREANPHNAKALVQAHGDRVLWVNPPPVPLTTPEMDFVYDRPFARVPHPQYGTLEIPAYQMIRFSVTIQRGCFGGCTFCSITEHEGRIIQNRSEASILGEVAALRDGLPGFTGVVSDLGGPTANMYRIACKSREIEAACRKPSCVYPAVCDNLVTDHSALIALYRKARAIPGIKKILIASGVRYDLAVEDPRYVKELVTHHVGGYLKIAPEHLADGPLSKMMKPGMGKYDEFKRLFERYSAEAGKKQYLIPYFIAAHPGTTDEDMLELALWLKKNGFKADQVQTFLPSPMATATAMYHSGKNPLKKITRDGEDVHIPRGLKVRRLHKAFLRWHDPANWPLLREALVRMGRADLIGSGSHQLVPRDGAVPPADAHAMAPGQRFRTQHTGIANAARPSPSSPAAGRASHRRDVAGLEEAEERRSGATRTTDTSPSSPAAGRASHRRDVAGLEEAEERRSGATRTTDTSPSSPAAGRASHRRDVAGLEEAEERRRGATRTTDTSSSPAAGRASHRRDVAGLEEAEERRRGATRTTDTSPSSPAAGRASHRRDVAGLEEAEERRRGATRTTDTSPSSPAAGRASHRRDVAGLEEAEERRRGATRTTDTSPSSPAAGRASHRRDVAGLEEAEERRRGATRTTDTSPSPAAGRASHRRDVAGLEEAEERRRGATRTTGAPRSEHDRGGDARPRHKRR